MVIFTALFFLCLSLSFSLGVLTSNLFLFVSSGCTVQLTGFSCVCLRFEDVVTNMQCMYLFIHLVLFLVIYQTEEKKKRKAA